MLSQLDRSTASAFIFNPRLEPLDFFKVLFVELGIEAPCRTKAEYLLALNQFLIERLERGEPTPLLIVDEAQNLSAEMLEEVRLLSNLETPTSKLIQIMLIGQPELKALLDRSELRQLRQRIALRHELRPFDENETALYIDERLARAGYTGKSLFKRGGGARDPRDHGRDPPADQLAVRQRASCSAIHATSSGSTRTRSARWRAISISSPGRKRCPRAGEREARPRRRRSRGVVDCSGASASPRFGRNGMEKEWPRSTTR